MTRVFLFLQEKQVFESSNGFHTHPYISKYHHTNFQTSIHSDAPSELKQSTDDPFDQKSQQTVKNEIFCQSPYFVKGFIILSLDDHNSSRKDQKSTKP